MSKRENKLNKFLMRKTINLKSKRKEKQTL